MTLTKTIATSLALILGLGVVLAQAEPATEGSSLAGRYVTNVTHDDLQAYDYTFDIDLVGEWTVVIGDDGFVRFRYEPPEGSGWQPYVHVAAYEVDGERFTIEPTVGNSLCDVPQEATSGDYSWTASEDELSFTVVQDDCTPRRIVFVADAWQRVRR